MGPLRRKLVPGGKLPSHFQHDVLLDVLLDMLMIYIYITSSLELPPTLGVKTIATKILQLLGSSIDFPT
jgi:hypothetical protein